MGFYSMAFQGIAPFGSLLAGWLSRRFDVREVVLASAVLILLAADAFGMQIRRIRRSARPVNQRLGISLLPPRELIPLWKRSRHIDPHWPRCSLRGMVKLAGQHAK